MHSIDRIYIDGAFVTPHGTERAELFNPSTQEKIGDVRLGDVEDARAAIAAAKRAFPAMARTSRKERIAMLLKLRDAVAARRDDIAAAMQEEYGAPQGFVAFAAVHASTAFGEMAKTLETYPFERTIGRATVQMRPLGVVAAITPWNSNAGFIASKLATAIAAGSSIVIKPSEMSGLQTDVMLEALHAAGLPNGVFNVVNGLGAVVGAELSAHPDIAKISFTGSTATGKAILAAASQTMKRVTLELGGKGPNILLQDADLDIAIPQVLQAGFANSGQACIAGTRILAPRSRLAEIEARLVSAIADFRAGDPRDPAVRIGPMVSQKQWDRVQSYIRLGVEEGARLIAGGEGRPAELNRGWFVRPTIFADVNNDMRIAREEIFGPVLCLIAYEDEAEAVSIANDTSYGLQSYVFSADTAHARRIADGLETGRVVINGAPREPQAPFGGFKQSGIGREFGSFGLEAFLEPRSVLV